MADSVLESEPQSDMTASVSEIPANTTESVIQNVNEVAPEAGGSLLNESLASFQILLQHEALTPVIDFLQTGGPVVWILCLFSAFALTIIFLKSWQFVSLRAESNKDVKLALSHWRKVHPEQAIESLKTKRPVSDVVAYAMTELSKSDYDLALVKEEIERLADEKIQALKAYLRPLEVVATLSPLLGLLGTVLGMIVAFQNMESAGSQVDPSVLSGGIWQALLTTAVGLAVAIPVVAMHALFERKVERIIFLMSDSVTQVFTHKGEIEEAKLNLLEQPEIMPEQDCAA
ncbi:MotA/TolQ/ExbB proton channel family protein [Marinomonas sp. MED121]|uniref:MotA/TolQ/ExbB proton channel family protein n=1 Tax=Marinomonas sp. MED121 TaxID=314277 RepID=UPI0002F5A3FD|nr:MotA/TolQ/ExbB proton channel family protein [Marinomonas sp. MED121]